MKRVVILALGLLALTAAPLPGRAEWGWPPPGYSATGIRACDGSQYRGLCALIRDRRHGACPCCTPAPPAPCAGDFPATPAAQAAASPAPQLPAAGASPRP